MYPWEKWPSSSSHKVRRHFSPFARRSFRPISSTRDLSGEVGVGTWAEGETAHVGECQFQHLHLWIEREERPGMPDQRNIRFVRLESLF